MAAPRTPAAKVAKTPRRQARNGTPQSSQTAAAPSNYRHNWTAQQYWLLVQWLEENREYYMTKGPKWHDKYEHIREWLKPSDFGEVTGLSARYPELKGKDVPSTTNIESGLRYLKNGHTRRNGQLAKTGQGIDELSDVQILQNQNLIAQFQHEFPWFDAMGDILGVSHTLNPPYVHETGIGEPADASSQMSESGNNDNEETGRGLTDLDLDGGIDGLDSDPSTPLEEEFDIALGTFEAHVSQASAKFDSQRSQPPVTITAEDESASQPTANPPLSTPKGIDQHVKNRRRSSEKRVKTEEDTRPGKRGRLAGQTDAQAAPYKDAMESLNDKISSQRYDDIALLFKHEADMKAQERKERDERDAKEKKEREERDAKEKKEREERDARDREEREQRDERLFAMFGALIAKSNN